MGQDRLSSRFSRQRVGGGEEVTAKREAKQTGEGQTDLLGNATNVFPHEGGRGERDGGKAYMLSHQIFSLCLNVHVVVVNRQTVPR